MAVGDDGSDGNSCPKSDERCRRIIDVGWRWSVNDRGAVHRNINDLRIRRHDLHDRVSHINNLGFISSLHNGIGDNHDLLGRALERADGLRLGTQRLDGIHQFQRLVNKGLAEFNGPSQFIAHFLNHGREPGHCFDILVP